MKSSSYYYSRKVYSGGTFAAPTRDEILGINGGLIHFQGLVVPTNQFGNLPLFESCIAWLKPEDRLSVWNTKKGVNDTHALIHLPFGPPLYDEPNQPYNAQNFPALDWTNGGTFLDPQFDALVHDVISNGFNKIFLFLGGDGADNYPIALKHLDLLAADNDFYNNLYKYCIPLPGYDGVFYGWPIEKIIEFGKKFRSIWLNGHLGLEHSTGHIPLGEGGDDYKPGGRLQDFDIILSEYAQDLHQDSCWQINGRLVRGYKRPPDQPSSDDPTPPYYLSIPNARGAWGHCALENGEYEFVRGGCSDQSVQIVEQNRAYQYSQNCLFVG